MFIEEQELNDWDVNPHEPSSIRRQKSISAYWLNNWIKDMEKYTFKTVIYSSIEEIPDVLPFDKCMVRYENKSPKDSDTWGPISTKNELVNLFYTSLRCKTNPGQYYCVREWINLGCEYRCFWNNGLVAVSSEGDIKPPIEQIFNYIQMIKHKIKFHKCVFDLAHITNTNELIFVEYNSWETNSGAHRFNWSDDKEIFYCVDKNITIRWNGGEIKVSNYLTNLTVLTVLTNSFKKFQMDNNIYEFVQLTYPSNYLITNKHIYISNDVWLGRFDYNLNPLNWISGVFRFSGIESCIGDCICIDNKYYYSDLTPKTTKSAKTNILTKDNIINYRYGIPIKNKTSSEIIFIRMLDNCELVHS